MTSLPQNTGSTIGYAVALVMIVVPASGSVTEYTSKSLWQHAVGEYTTIPFVGYPGGTIITTQYAQNGVLFTDGNDRIQCCPSDLFLQDGAGLNGGACFCDNAIHIKFLTSQRWIGVDYPGGVRIELYQRDRLLHVSDEFGFGMSGPGLFAGIISSEPFDRAILTDWFDGSVVIDDLHFGAPAPALCADLNGDGLVNGQDLAVLLGSWSVPSGAPCAAPTCPADFFPDGTINGLDLALFLGHWGHPQKECTP